MNQEEMIRGAQIDALQRAAMSGELTRREFITRLLALGVSLSVAMPLAVHAEAVWNNQQARRADLRDAYDYIIVGGGSAGCVLANRISARGASVLLIEAGSGDVSQPKIDVATLWPQNLGSDTDWAQLSVPQANLANRTLTMSGGRVLGGSGSINVMLWLRGDPRDFLRWEQMVGPEWNLPALARNFVRTETYLPGDRPLRGRDGPIAVGRYASQHPITPAFLEGGQELGLRVIDMNSGGPLDGVGVAEANILPDGRRAGPAEGYLLPIMTRPNLTVLPNTLVTKLVVQHGHCAGVRFVVDGVEQTIRATHETLLCTGTLQTPKLLMLSGIGPAAQLTPLGIPVQQELAAVGANLHDHIVLLNLLFKSPAPIAPELANGVSAFAFFSSSPKTMAPDVELACSEGPFLTPALPPGAGFSIVPFLGKPRSRGSVSLQSTDPTQQLRIDPNFLAESIDQDNALLAVDSALALTQTSALRNYSSGYYGTLPLASEADRRAFITQNALAGFHPVGTCAAGRDPQSSVVDGRFRVWGVEKLRIVDGSVIPEIPCVNIHAPILTLAELAAEKLGFAP